MGNQCGCGKAPEDPMIVQKRMNNLVKIQALVRSFLAKQKKKSLKKQKMKGLFSSDKKNHKKTETWMLTQRIGPLNLEKLRVEDGVERIYFDKFVDSEDGKSYKGEWQKNNQNIRDGVGIMFFEDGSKYEGQFRKNHPHGEGRKMFSNGEYYVGGFANGKADGYGVFFDLNGGKYEGPWANDKQHGVGKETWNNGAETYEGDFVMGKKNGKGKFNWSDGSYYEGDFVDGIFQGYGVYYFKDQDKTYCGTFVEGRIEGEGEMKWGDGREYWGQFRDGKEDGEGTFKYANGNMYIGKFKEGKMSGFAIFIDQEAQTKRHGEWKDGKRTQWLSSPEAINTDNSPVKRPSYM